jgi:hypothetical protein
MPKDYDLDRKTARIRGNVILKLEPPQGMSIDWFTPGACFNTHQNQGAKNTDNRIAYAVDEPANFQEVYKANVPTWVNHWRYQWDEDVRLEKPAKSVFVRYTGNPGVNVIRATVHLTPRKPPHKNIQVTHAYQVGGELIEKVFELKNPGEYTVNVEGEPKNTYIRLAVPSRSSVNE